MRACVNGTTTLLSRAMNIAAIPILKAQLMGLVQALSQAATEDSMGNMLSSEQWDLLLPYLRPMELPVGQVLFAQGTTERTLYLVESGSLTVHYEDEQQRVRLAIVGPGSVVGEGALFSHRPRSATVQAGAPTRLWNLTAIRFAEFANRNPAVALQLVMAIGAVQAKRLANRRRRVAST